MVSNTTLKADAAQPWQFGLQDPATPIAEGIIAFHHDLMFILVFVVGLVVWFGLRHCCRRTMATIFEVAIDCRVFVVVVRVSS